MIRVELPSPLRLLAGIAGDVPLDLPAPISVASVLDALEVRYPMLHGTMRNPATRQRRPFIRFFACARDLSHAPLDTPLPAAVISGEEPLLIVGAMSGG